MGSVKDLEILKQPTSTKMGLGRFRFSDRYSVFDWGEMPDLIEGKGAALCLMGAHCFEKLEERGIKSHYRGIIDTNGRLVSVNEIEQPSDIMEVDLVNVYRPGMSRNGGRAGYDYSVYTPQLRNFLIPLEIIYRNGLPEGSSVFRRLEQGQITIEELGLDRYPQPGERLAKPIFDVSTKLEEKDRYLTWIEAQKMAGLTTEEVQNIKEVLLSVDRMITQTALKVDLENEDGKIEVAFDPERRVIVVDVVGTLDECRFTFEGLHVSKEITRQFYRKTQWYRDVEEAKRKAETEGIKNWKKLCQCPPPRLDPVLKRMIAEMYMAVSNEVIERKFFDVPKLAETVKKYREFAGAA